MESLTIHQRKKRIIKKLNELPDDNLSMLENFLNYLHLKTITQNIKNKSKVDEWKILYEKFADEDAQLAELGLEEYAELLKKEDK